MMPGAEGECRFDFDCDPAREDGRAVMRAVHDETAGLDRLEAGQTGGDPVALGDALKPDRLSGGAAGDRAHEISDLIMVGRLFEVNLDVPFAARLFEHGDRDTEPIRECVGEAAGARRIGRDLREVSFVHPCHSGWAIGVQHRSSLRSPAITLAAL